MEKEWKIFYNGSYVDILSIDQYNDMFVNNKVIPYDSFLTYYLPDLSLLALKERKNKLSIIDLMKMKGTNSVADKNVFRNSYLLTYNDAQVFYLRATTLCEFWKFWKIFNLIK